jgi:hypothetical protein
MAKATQFAKIVTRIRYSNGFHSTMSMQSFRRGFFRPRQKRARTGRSVKEVKDVIEGRKSASLISPG